MRLLLITALSLIGCQTHKIDNACGYNIEPSNSMGSILVIGDSISMGYYSTVHEELSSYEVIHNPCNGRNSRYGLAKLDEWLGARPSWQAITFNHGIWDTTHVDGYYWWLEPEEYRSNLTQIAMKIKAKTANPVFVLSVEVPACLPKHNNADIVRYNQIAIDVMAKQGIPILDLYSVSLPLASHHQGPCEVHFDNYGYNQLGLSVSNYLNGVL